MVQMAQMVCGSCRQLFSYPEGTRQDKCSCCETVNFVLEGFFLLLMSVSCV
ncbi:Protein LOL2 [Gossypium arboreum]|uniref:Protein LOL2 n=1 Tax=Gossypium arboreum TaxID=29729 RepID=A0A0B0PXS1_GOSAR|nr:Protein LOL2 [Gossypium arboreum]